MKLKKIAAGVAAAAIAVSAMTAVSASAISGSTSIDFEDGDYSFVYMNTDSGADKSVLSVVDYNGSKKLKVDVQDKKMVPKVWFDLDKITDRSNTVQIRTIEFDLTIVPKTEDGIIGWAGGALGTAGGFDPKAAGSGQVKPSWSDKAWDGGAYNPGEAAEVHISRTFLRSTEFYTTDGVNPFFGLMRWAAADQADYVMYIDDVVLKDEKGNNLPIGVTPAPAADEATDDTTSAAEEATDDKAAAPVKADSADLDDDADADIVDTDDDDDTAADVADNAAPAVDTTADTAADTNAAAAVADNSAPAADKTTTAVATGNVAVASIAAVMAVAGAAAIVSKKRK